MPPAARLLLRNAPRRSAHRPAAAPSSAIGAAPPATRSRTAPRRTREKPPEAARTAAAPTRTPPSTAPPRTASPSKERLHQAEDGKRRHDHERPRSTAPHPPCQHKKQQPRHPVTEHHRD